MIELATNGNVLNDIRKIIEEGRRQAYATAGQIAIATYWNIGKRIVEEEQQGQQGQERAKYGAKLIANLAQQLTLKFRTISTFLLEFQRYRNCERARSQFDVDSLAYHNA